MLCVAAGRAWPGACGGWMVQIWWPLWRAPRAEGVQLGSQSTTSAMAGGGGGAGLVAFVCRWLGLLAGFQ